jgi:hypothetical protein
MVTFTVKGILSWNIQQIPGYFKRMQTVVIPWNISVTALVYDKSYGGIHIHVCACIYIYR